MNCSCCEEPVTFVHAKDKTGQIAIRPCTKNNRPPCQIRRDPLVGSAFRRDACRVRDVMFDYRSRFIGHDEHAPPNRFDSSLRRNLSGPPFVVAVMSCLIIDPAFGHDKHAPPNCFDSSLRALVASVMSCLIIDPASSLHRA
jgi:hypothetical protein